MTALVPTGLVVVCCDDHQSGCCCTPVDCAPCCPECPTCVEVQARTSAQRAADAATHRALLATLAAWTRDIRHAPMRWGAPPWPINSL